MPTNFRPLLRLVAAATLPFVLASCGGGGGNPGTCQGSTGVCFGLQPGGGTPATPDALAGIFTGTSSTGRTVHAVGDDNGNLWMLYSGAGAPLTLAGVEEGSVSAVNGSVTIADLADLSAASGVVAHGSLSGTYVTASSLAATVSLPQVASVNATFQTGSGSVVTTAPLAGSWIGTSVVAGATESAMLTITSGGAITGTTTSLCQITGSAVPQQHVAAYAVALTFFGGTCANVTPVSGVALIDGSALMVGTLNANRSNGFVFSGTQ
ncbi:MAG TPA: hypothetical protein VHA82_17190 [Ramlibacter sp.]|uniref:hypothetical protein n=1 Tax=Ramlibacter sp. TaxID=1917967 RepID=UPI002C93A09C|nr:hypothetical protein [Ramlibacter sp.]HVZ45548.1 hypothetical protein [Ramlibacter sp.]